MQGRWYYEVNGERSERTFVSQREADREATFEAETQRNSEIYHFMEDAWRHHAEIGIDWREAQRQAREQLGFPTTQYESCALRGGENYREVLLTLPRYGSAGGSDQGADRHGGKSHLCRDRPRNGL
jgi:hypothetical protein